MKKTLKLKNVLYWPTVNVIGGVETYIYEMALKYGKTYDITVLYKTGDKDRLKKIASVARIVHFDPDTEIACDVFIFGMHDDILDNIKAKEYVQTFHADYIRSRLKPSMDGRITKRIGVSENVANGIRKGYGLDVETVYNPYTVKKPRKILRLVSATRLAANKGLSRMIQLANALDAAGIPFQWTVFTDGRREYVHKSMVLMPPRMDILDYIADADYLVQLSDSEAYAYSVIEALSVGTPVIVTDIPTCSEMGVENGKTGFILPMDMSEIPVDAIYKGLKKFEYTPRDDHYDRILAKGKANCKIDTVIVECVQQYFDMETKTMQNVGDIHEVTRERADILCGKGLTIAW